MKVSRHEGVDVFAEVVRDFLLKNEAENNLLLGLISDMQADPHLYQERLLFSVSEEDDVQAVAIMTPPHPVVISSSAHENAGRVLAEYLQDDGIVPPGVNGPKREAQSFAKSWAQLTSSEVHLKRASRIYRLEQVVRPGIAAGTLRKMTSSDLDIFTTYIRAFGRETGDGELDPAKAREAATRYLAGKGRRGFVWDVDGEPVSVVAALGQTPNGIRIGAVYTPPEYRRKGFASASVAEISQLMLDEGRSFCFLYTDLANPTSNHIYQQIGYRPICDADHIIFG